MILRRIVLREGNFLVDGRFQLCDVRIVGSTIAEVSTQIKPSKNEVVVSLEGLHVLPGLINSHDHLELNVFPRLGHPPYSSYVEWADDIQKSYLREIKSIVQIPLRYRLLWGAYKNIFSGVTTVVHHNPYYWQFRYAYPLEVYHPYSWIHSLKLEKRDLKKLLTRISSKQFIHLAEGINAASSSELKELWALNGLSDRTVVIHGVALTDEDIELMSSVGCGFVWCPVSNIYLFQKTAPVEKMLGKIPLALGSDSTLTGSVSFFDEMRAAKNAKQLDSQCILDLATSSAARLLKVNKGEIRRGAFADLLVFETEQSDPFEDSLCLSAKRVKCLWKNGSPIFGDFDLGSPALLRTKTFTTVNIQGSRKFVTGDFPGLINKIRTYSPIVDLPQICPQ